MKMKTLFYVGIFGLFVLFYTLGRQHGKIKAIAVYQRAVTDSYIYFENRTSESVDEVILSVPESADYPPLRIIQRLNFEKSPNEDFELLLPLPDDGELKESNPPPTPKRLTL